MENICLEYYLSSVTNDPRTRIKSAKIDKLRY